MDMPIFQPTAEAVEDDAMLVVLDLLRRPDLTRPEPTPVPLCKDARGRIFAAIDTPSVSTWRAARSLVVTPHGMGRTLWQLMLAVNPEASEACPTGRQIMEALVLASAEAAR